MENNDHYTLVNDMVSDDYQILVEEVARIALEMYKAQIGHELDLSDELLDELQNALESKLA